MSQLRSGEPEAQNRSNGLLFCLFVLWESGFPSASLVLRDINEEFDIRKAELVDLPPLNAGDFFGRFYGKRRPDRYKFKEREVGGTRALIILVTPQEHQEREPEDFYDDVRCLKERFRHGGKNFLHGADSSDESESNYFAVGGSYEALMSALSSPAIVAVVANSKSAELDLRTFAKREPANFDELFTRLGEYTNYVVLRNWEDIDVEKSLVVSGDIDILVDDAPTAQSVLMAKRAFHDESRVHFLVPVSGQAVPFDIRFLGDNYYDRAWQKRMLETKVPRGTFFALDDYQYYWTLLYHAIVHKGLVSELYRNRLGKLSRFASLNFGKKSDNRLRSRLLQYLSKNGYGVPKPNDKSVARFLTDLAIIRRAGYVAKFLSSNLGRLIYRQDFSGLACFESYPPARRGRPLTRNIYRVGEFIVRKSNGPLSNVLLRNEFEHLKELQGTTGFPEVLGLFGQCDSLFLVTYAVEGRSLDSVFWISPKQIKACATQLDSLLARLERVGLIHRDLSPSNLIWDGQKLSLVDFEFARKVEQEITTYSQFEKAFLESILPGVGRDWREPNVAPEECDRASVGSIQAFIARQWTLRAFAKRLATKFKAGGGSFSIVNSATRIWASGVKRFKVIARRAWV